MDELKEGIDYIIENNVLKINEGVKYIPKNCFNSFYNIVSVEINEIILPQSLLVIGENAFRSFGNLKKIVIPDNVRYILGNAFNSCSINELTIGKNVSYIGMHAFSSNKLKVINNNSKNLKVIDMMAFGDNPNLISFDFDSNNKNIFVERYAFNFTKVPLYVRSNLNKFVIPFDRDETFREYSDCDSNNGCCYETKDKYTYENGVLKIKDGVGIIGNFSELKNCTSIEMPDSVFMIQNGAFYGLSKLENIKFSKNLIIIESNAFNGCGFNENTIKLPESLCSLDISAFWRKLGSQKILISNICEAKDYHGYTDFDSTYEVYPNSLIVDNLEKRYSINIEELLENERIILEGLGLLPDTIKNNCKLNKTFNKRQEELIKNSLLDVIDSPEYDENKDINFVIKILELKEINIYNIHLSINSLFERKQIKTLYLLMSYGYDYLNNSTISRAIINDLYEMIDVLLILGVNINEINTIDMTPLGLASQKGNLELVKHLIEKGAAINMVDKNNKKAIDYALENNHNDIALLINSYNVEKSETETDLDIILKKIR